MESPLAAGFGGRARAVPVVRGRKGCSHLWLSRLVALTWEIGLDQNEGAADETDTEA